jgi:toxin ParE1/3/4
MRRRFTLRPKAQDDVGEIIDHIASHHVDAAKRFARAFREDCVLLADHPNAGPRVGRAPKRLLGLRYFPVRGFRNYLILYLPIVAGVEVVRVVHGARRMGPLLRDA